MIANPPLLLGHPVKARISGGFGDDYGGYRHRGIDYETAEGSPLHFNGIEECLVEEPYNDGSFGIAVAVDLGGGAHAIYAHLKTRFVIPGERVRPGQLMGLTGNTGRTTGPHLHFQISDSPMFPSALERSIDPLPLMLTRLGGPELPNLIDRIDGLSAAVARLERVAGGNGIDAIPRPGLEDLFPAGTATYPEGTTGKPTRIRGEAALRYADRRGFSLALGLSQAQERIAQLAQALADALGADEESGREALLELAELIQKTYGRK
ncbi:MAG: M23 family metallopeptidase [Desulfurellales bacterium]|nr:MAG: M23 family metallopeptidase [Desulfurellales bacterium]